MAQGNPPARKPRLAPMDLVATTAHELKSPLVLISGLVEMLAAAEFGKVTQKQIRYLEKIGGASERLLRMIDNLLTINKSEHGQLRIVLEPLSIIQVIKRVLDELQPKILAKQMTVIWPPHLAVPPVLADGQLVYQVFFNLLDNTLKYSPARTTVNIRFRRGPGYLAVQVRDQGYGIKPSDLMKLFERFGQVNQPISAQASSSGLGLFIVKNLVQLMGGQVSAKRLKQGTCFTVSLPTVQQLGLFDESGAS
ncbi:HAMP domain-containing histidine kinase [Candidatus Microgenomates bacterium]|nr:HAMP domain-containing histidine kinase [Candidatus Microgenomates bacterium]